MAAFPDLEGRAQELEAFRTASVLERADVDEVEPAGGDEVGDLCARFQLPAGKRDRLAMSMMNGPTWEG